MAFEDGGRPPSHRGRSLCIYNAVDGRAHDVPISLESSTVAAVREILYSRTGIAVDDQILLYGPPYARLDHRRPLSAYGPTLLSKKIFLFNRRSLSPNTPPPSVATIEIPEQSPESLPLPPTSSGSRILSEYPSPLLRALADYEQQFAVNLRLGQSILQRAQTKITACGESISQQKVQAEALEAAVTNLESFKDSIGTGFRSFWELYTDQKLRHERLLEQFPDFLKRLEEIQLHRVLQLDDRRTLFDCIPAERERQWASDCRQAHGHLTAKAEELEKVFQEIIEGVKEELQKIFPVDFESLEQEHREGESLLKKLSNDVDTLQANYETVISGVNETLSQLSGSDSASSSSSSTSSSQSQFGLTSTRALEMCRGLDELWAKQGDIVSEMNARDKSLDNLLQRCADCKTVVARELHGRLRQVSVFQSKIRDLGNTMSMLREAMTMQKQQFAELEHVERLPEAYNASLKEVARRRSYGRLFTAKIGAMAEELGNLREGEVALREEFLRKHGQHLPRDLLPGLAEKPPHCELRTRPFDQALPEIDDVEEDGISARATKDHEQKDREGNKEGQQEQAERGGPGGSLILAPNPAWEGRDSAAELKIRCKELEYEVAKLKALLSKEQSRVTEKANVEDKGVETEADDGDTDKPRDDKEEDKVDEEVKVEREEERKEGDGDARISEGSDNGKPRDTGKEDKGKGREPEIVQQLRGELEKVRKELEEAKEEHKSYVLNAAEFEADIASHVGREKELESALKANSREMQVTFTMQMQALSRLKKLLDEGVEAMVVSEETESESGSLLISSQEEYAEDEEGAEAGVAEEQDGSSRGKGVKKEDQEEQEKKEGEEGGAQGQKTHDQHSKKAGKAGRGAQQGRKDRQGEKKEDEGRTASGKTVDEEGEEPENGGINADESDDSAQLELSSSSSSAGKAVDEFGKKLKGVEDKVKGLLVEKKKQKISLEARAREIVRLKAEKLALNENKISFRGFEVGDLALFLPTSAPGEEGEGRIYLAFHLGCPHRYLSEESIDSFKAAENRYPDYILGKIVFIDEEVATEGRNPYELRLGTVFFTLTVASLTEGQ